MPDYYAYGIRLDIAASSVNQLCKIVIHQACIGVCIRSGFVEIPEVIFQVLRSYRWIQRSMRQYHRQFRGYTSLTEVSADMAWNLTIKNRSSPDFRNRKT